MNRVVNWFTILLIIIFDPLAVALVVVLNNIMKSRQTAENVSKPDVEQEAESKAESVKATTPPSIDVETNSDSSLVENALKKYKESKDRTISQPVKPTKSNIKRID